MMIMSEPIKAESINCARCLFEKVELDEGIAEWQQYDEERNLEIINQHEAAQSTEQEASCLFTKELKRRNIK